MDNTPTQNDLSPSPSNSGFFPVTRVRFGNGAKLLLLYVVLSVFYAGWVTGFTFVFSECNLWPNYNMLAGALAKGQLYLDEKVGEDYVWVNGRAYMYAGPVPALLRLPVRLIFKRGIPTGLMLALFCAGVSVLFIASLSLVALPVLTRSATLIRVVFAFVIVLNGYSLLMVTIPSFHHEAIASAMFFLMAGIYLFFRAKYSMYRPAPWIAISLGTAMGLCLGSRLSYGPSVGFLALILAGGILLNWKSQRRKDMVRTVAIVFAIIATSVALLAAYNYGRYGSLLETGMTYQSSYLFADYFRNNYYFRYDHIPYNLWSYFFRMPVVVPQFPFIGLPAYLMKVDSVRFLPYHLMYLNELSVSVFCLMPILVLMFYPLASRLLELGEPPASNYGTLAAIFFLQVIPVSLTVGTTARYYYDFVPIAALMAYLGTLQLNRQARTTVVLVVLLGVLSIVLGLSLPIQAVAFYRAVISYDSPLGYFF